MKLVNLAHCLGLALARVILESNGLQIGRKLELGPYKAEGIVGFAVDQNYPAPVHTRETVYGLIRAPLRGEVEILFKPSPLIPPAVLEYVRLHDVELSKSEVSYDERPLTLR